jgi:hypothetical protein
MTQPLITLSRHPCYTLVDYLKFNLTYEGGRNFINKYLKRFDSREDKDQFLLRKSMTYNPGFAAEALDEIKNGIYQRMGEIVRTGGTKSYTRAVSGKDGGVDLEGSSMDTFMGQKALPELLKMGRTGIYVDMPAFNPYSTLAEYTVTPHPYLYTYKCEDILNWRQMYCDNEMVYTAVLLRERHWKYNDAGLPTEEVERFRLVRLLPGGGVIVQFYEQFSDGKTTQERVVAEFTLPKLKRIPFIPLDIGKSVLTDAADYQIGLLNLASADLNYAVTCNFPFYVEGYDPKTENLFSRQGPQTSFDAEGQPVEQPEANGSNDAEIRVGTHHGRKYPYEAKPPQFIHPSPEPLKASMQKQEQMQQEIRRLLNLGVTNVAPSRASAESKKVDQIGLESGLSAIGMELQGAEREIAEIWSMYEGESTEGISVSYPTTYSLKTDEQRVVEAGELQKVKGAAPSKKFQKEIAKRIARSLLEGKIPQEQLSAILKEVDAAEYSTSDWKEISQDVESGLVDAVTASNARGYNGDKVVPKAHEERVKRMSEIAIAQTPGGGAGANSEARGGEGVPNAKDEKTASQNPDKQPLGTTSKRGAANGN